MENAIYIQDGDKRRKATAKEVEQLEQDLANTIEQNRLIEAEQQAKIQARESAIAKLAALGLTEDEVKAIVGA